MSIEEPMTNIEVKLTIPSQTYRAAAQEVMSSYSNIVVEALQEVKADLMFNEKFQEEVKSVIKDRIQDSVEAAVKAAANSVVWDLYRSKDMDIQKMVEKAILSSIAEK